MNPNPHDFWRNLDGKRLAIAAGAVFLGWALLDNAYRDGVRTGLLLASQDGEVRWHDLDHGFPFGPWLVIAAIVGFVGWRKGWWGGHGPGQGNRPAGPNGHAAPLAPPAWVPRPPAPPPPPPAPTPTPTQTAPAPPAPPVWDALPQSAPQSAPPPPPVEVRIPVTVAGQAPTATATAPPPPVATTPQPPAPTVASAAPPEQMKSQVPAAPVEPPVTPAATPEATAPEYRRTVGEAG